MIEFVTLIAILRQICLKFSKFLNASILTGSRGSYIVYRKAKFPVVVCVQGGGSGRYNTGNRASLGNSTEMSLIEKMK